MRLPRSFPRLALFVPILILCKAAAQANLPIYTDHLVNNFQDWSWLARNLNNASPVHSGTASASASGVGSLYQALSFEHSDFNATVYSSLSFWANGGPTGGQKLQVSAQYGSSSGPAVQLALLPTNSWQQYTISLSSLGVANAANLNRLNIQLTPNGTSTNTFYVDDVQLTAKAAPALAHINVNATQNGRTVDARMFSVNTAIWDNSFDTSTTISRLNEMRTRTLRFPGGSASDEYHWAVNRSLNNTWTWATSFGNFVHVATNVGVQAFITVNYGTGTPAEAASWVSNANVTNHYGFKYWEIGNECYGSWETDSNSFPHDPYTYAVRAKDYIQQMKAVDPTIKIGVVSASGENSYSNSYSLSHPAVNPRTGKTNYGWTPIMLATLKNLGVTPDFLIEHNYPQYTGPESDALLLQTGPGWTSEATDLRQQITDYLGAPGTNVELVCTENNSSSGTPGRQTTSLVNGLYYADSFCHILQTEINGFVWWDLRNGMDLTGNYDPTIYGWRTYGDQGMISGPGTNNPVFYAAKMMQYLAQPGDTVLTASSDYLLLYASAAKSTNGNLSVLVMNKDTLSNFNAQIVLNGYLPDPAATVRFFGVPQDEAARTNGPAASRDISQSTFGTATTNFTYSFPPLSLTVFTFTPAVAPAITNQPQDKTVVAGMNATFAASASGSPQLGYRWRFNGSFLPGATTSGLTISNAQFSNAGSYSVVVTNFAGAATSTAASLVVRPAPSLLVEPNGGTAVSMSFTGYAGFNYLVEYKSNLDAPQWLPLTNLPGTDSAIFFSDSPITNASRFYRVRVQ